MLHDITDPTEITVTPVFAVKAVSPGGDVYIMADGNYYERFDHALEYDEHVGDDIVQAVEAYRKDAFDAVADKIVATAAGVNLGNLPQGEGGTLDTDTVRHEPVLSPMVPFYADTYGVTPSAPGNTVAPSNAALENLGTRTDGQPVNFPNGKVDPLDAMGHIAKARVAASIAQNPYSKAMEMLPQGAVAALNAELEELGAQVKGQYATFI